MATMSEQPSAPMKPDAASLVLYATFPRRLNALSVDVLVFIAATVVMLLVAASLQDTVVGRGVLFVLWIAAGICYEPVLVSRRGGTIGHAAMNLCVVFNRTGKHLSLPRAILRTWLKGFLGIISFFSMNFSQRHQALHDILTGSSVRIRDVSKAKPHQYWARAT